MDATDDNLNIICITVLCLIAIKINVKLTKYFTTHFRNSIVVIITYL